MSRKKQAGAVTAPARVDVFGRDGVQSFLAAPAWRRWRDDNPEVVVAASGALAAIDAGAAALRAKGVAAGDARAPLVTVTGGAELLAALLALADAGGIAGATDAQLVVAPSGEWRIELRMTGAKRWGPAPASQRETLRDGDGLDDLPEGALDARGAGSAPPWGR